MNITLKRTEEQVELVKAMASRDKAVAYEAQQALAEHNRDLRLEIKLRVLIGVQESLGVALGKQKHIAAHLWDGIALRVSAKEDTYQSLQVGEL